MIALQTDQAPLLSVSDAVASASTEYCRRHMTVDAKPVQKLWRRDSVNHREVHASRKCEGSLGFPCAVCRNAHLSFCVCALWYARPALLESVRCTCVRQNSAPGRLHRARDPRRPTKRRPRPQFFSQINADGHGHDDHMPSNIPMHCGVISMASHRRLSLSCNLSITHLAYCLQLLIASLGHRTTDACTDRPTRAVRS